MIPEEWNVEVEDGKAKCRMSWLEVKIAAGICKRCGVFNAEMRGLMVERRSQVTCHKSRATCHVRLPFLAR